MESYEDSEDDEERSVVDEQRETDRNWLLRARVTSHAACLDGEPLEALERVSAWMASNI